MAHFVSTLTPLTIVCYIYARLPPMNDVSVHTAYIYIYTTQGTHSPNSYRYATAQRKVEYLYIYLLKQQENVFSRDNFLK